MDPLADVLDISRVRGALLAHVRAAAPWGLALPQSDGASFHTLTSGTAWLRVDGAEAVQLMPGDVLLLPSGRPHRLSSAPDGRCRPFDRVAKERLMTPEGELRLDGPGAVTTFVCAGYEYDHEVAQPLLSLLPPVLHVPAEPVAGARIATTVGLLAGELGAGDPGAPAAVARLIDLLLIQVVRAWSARAEDAAPSWLHALRDPIIARALAVLHERSAEPWTIARAVGYRSEYAFNRAFRRHRGRPPGRYRRAA